MIYFNKNVTYFIEEIQLLSEKALLVTTTHKCLFFYIFIVLYLETSL